jgi:hypothetical protein
VHAKGENNEPQAATANRPPRIQSLILSHPAPTLIPQMVILAIVVFVPALTTPDYTIYENREVHWLARL